MKQLLLSALAIGFLATSCSTTTDPDGGGGDGKYIPSTAGSYVIHSNFEKSIDTNNVITETQVSDDSTVVNGTKSITDDSGVTKTGTEFLVYTDTSVDTMYMAEEGSKVYIYLGLGSGDVGVGDINLGSQWVLWADSEGTNWTSFEQQFTGFELELEGQTLPADITLKITGRKLGTGSMSIDGKNVNTVNYEQVVSMTISVAVLPPPLPALEIPVEFTTAFSLGEGVGVVKQDQQPDVITIPVIGTKIPIGGYLSTAIRFEIQ